jgi:alpha-galactosidase
MSEKIVLIGAGSAVFTRGLVADLISIGWDTDLALVDIDPEALEVARRLVEKMISARSGPGASKASIRLTAALDRREVLKDATAVICTIGVGKRRAWEQDVFIPRKYGIYMPVGDTVGPGGTSRAMRMIPSMVDIARDVLELAPNALFFNYGNPMSPVCRAIRKATGAPVVGLCHGVHDTAGWLANQLGVPRETLSYTAVGINHLTWMYNIRSDDRDMTPEMYRIAREREAAVTANGCPLGPTPYDSSCGFPFSWMLMNHFGAFPAPLDRHTTEFFPQFYREGHYFGRTLGVDMFSFEGTIADGDRGYASMTEHAFAPGPLPADYFAHIGGEHEQVIDIIESIRTGRSKIYSANLPNTGQVPNLPLNAVIEAPAVTTGGGLKAITQAPLPAGIAGTLATRFQWVETVVEAALEGSREKFIQALILDGATCSIKQAEALGNELLTAQAAYLPQMK